MKRLSRLATLIVVTVFCSAAMKPVSSELTSSEVAECKQWDLNGQWTFIQTDGTSPKFELRMTATGLQGEASYSYLCGLPSCLYTASIVRASVDGKVDGNSFDVNAYWDNGTTGVYSGRIGPQGRLEGSTRDLQHPQVMLSWYSARTAKCLFVPFGAGGQSGSTSSALQTAPSAGKSLGRAKLPAGTAPNTPLPICEAARLARARNSAAAPGLEARCRAERATPLIAVEGRSGTTATAGIVSALQPANTIKVSVRYRKELGYKGDTNAFGNIGPTSCEAFSVSVNVFDGPARPQNPIPISSDSRMTDAGDYYVCNYLASEIPLDKEIRVIVGLSRSDLSATWKGGTEAGPPAGQQRTVVDVTRTAVLSASQPRARLSYDMVYAQIPSR